MSMVARFKTQCFACATPIYPGDTMTGYGQVYDRTKKKAVNAWYHSECLAELVRKAEIQQRMEAAPMPSGRHSRRTRRGWTSR